MGHLVTEDRMVLEGLKPMRGLHDQSRSIDGAKKGPHFIVLFAPTNMVLLASKLVCWLQNSSASGFVVTCCDPYCARCAAASRRDDWRGAWRWVWLSASIRL